MEQINADNKMNEITSKNKNLLILAVAIVVVVAIALMVRYGKKSAPAETMVPEEMQTTETTKSDTTGSTSGAMFSDVLKKYEGKMITFDADCMGTPKTSVQRAGTTIMLYNSDSVAHTIKVGNAVYAASARKYRTAVLGAPAITSVTCDGKDAAAITVQ